MTALDGKLRSALEALRSADLLTRVISVEELAEVVRGAVDEVVDLLVTEADGRYLVFERLGRFGSVAVRPLELAWSKEIDEEARVLVSAALVSLGSAKGQPYLLDILRENHPYLGLAVKVLSIAGVTESIDRIEATLRVCSLSNADVLIVLVEGLRRLGRPLPEDVRARLQAVGPAWLRDSLLG